eukprot:NODE_90_length_21806_cov_0.389137.p8 type:complete len:148 gc:universal NODE_90_length_21806_cov_0.389137:177-620(+)
MRINNPFKRPSVASPSDSIPASRLAHLLKPKPVIVDNFDLDDDLVLEKPEFSEFDLEIMKSKRTLDMVVEEVEQVDKGYILSGCYIILVYKRQLLFNELFPKKIKHVDDAPGINDVVKLTGYITRNLRDNKILYVTNTQYVEVIGKS